MPSFDGGVHLLVYSLDVFSSFQKRRLPFCAKEKQKSSQDESPSHTRTPVASREKVTSELQKTDGLPTSASAHSPPLHNSCHRIGPAVSFYGSSGELIGIFGPTGSGKSILLNAIAGADSPKSGSISWIATENNNTDIQNQGVTCDSKQENDFLATEPASVWLQSLSTDGKLTKLSNNLTNQICQLVTCNDCMIASATTEQTLRCAVDLRRPKLTDKERQEVVNELLKTFGLESCRKTTVGTLSKPSLSTGQRKRLHIAYSVAADPLCLLLDEPTSGLDSSSSARVIETLAGFCKKKKTLCITTIHQPTNQMFFSLDRVLVMSAGESIFFGSPKDAFIQFSHVYRKSLPVFGGEGMTELPKFDSTPPLDRLFLLARTHQLHSENGFDYFIPDGQFEDENKINSFLDSVPKSSYKKITKRSSWPSSFWTLFKRFCSQQFHESQFWLAVLVVFPLFGLLIGGVFRSVPTRLENATQFIPVRPVLPDYDVSGPASWVQESARRILSEIISNKFLRSNSEQTIQDGDSCDDQYCQTTNNFFVSALMYGIDGNGTNPVLDLLSGGLSSDYLSFSAASFMDCMHDDLNLSSIYPPVREDPQYYVCKDPSAGACRTAATLLEFGQMLDFIVKHTDLRDTMMCFDGQGKKRAYFCALGSQSNLLKTFIKCVANPSVLLFNSSRQPDSFFMDLENFVISNLFKIQNINNNRQDRTESPSQKNSDLSHSLVNGTVMSSDVPFNQQVVTQLSRITRDIPVELSIDQVLGRLLSPNSYPDLVDQYRNLTNNHKEFLDLASSADCLNPFCKILGSIPVALITIIGDVFDTLWSGVQEGALMFLLSTFGAATALAGVLVFSQQRCLANKESFSYYYRFSTYFISRLTTEFCFQIWPSVIFALICLLVSGVYTTSSDPVSYFFKILLGILLVTTSATGLTFFVSSLTTSTSLAAVLSSMLLTFFLLLSGMVLRSATDDGWYRVLGWFSFAKQGYAAMVVTQFPPGGSWGIIPNEFLCSTLFGVDSSTPYYEPILMLVMQTFLYRFLSYLSSRFLHRHVGVRGQ